MANIRSYKELRVYQAAMDAAMRIFELSKRFLPKKSTHSLIRYDAALDLCVQTLEKRGESAGIRPIFVSKLSDSEGEAEETRVWLEFASRCNYITEQEARELDETYDRILSQLVKMISGHEQWVIR